MRKENVRCPMLGTMNYDVDLDATDGWTKCRLCKAVTCSMDEWKKHTVSVPLLNEKQLVARSLSSREKSVCVLSPEKVISFQGCLQKITYFVMCCQEILAHTS